MKQGDKIQGSIKPIAYCYKSDKIMDEKIDRAIEFYNERKVEILDFINNVLAAAFVLSGKCRIGDVGEETGLEDITGEKLYVGDIVITSTIDEMGVCNNNGLTVVCSDKWTSYSDGTHKAKPNYEHFVMGIKNVDFMGKDRDTWMVKRVKSYKDVIVGEKWKDFGFSYVAE